MAIVRKFTEEPAARDTRHTECSGKLRAVESDGEKFIQIDTYGSADREMPGKVSQSLRLTENAVQQLIRMAAKHF
jgi:hypothetical protein